MSSPLDSDPVPAGQPGSSADHARDQWFAEQVLPHEAALRAWLRVRFPSIDDSDDVVQESYLRLLRAYALHSITSVRAFLFTTARNLALNQLRHRRHSHPKLAVEIDPSGVLDADANTPETVARDQEMKLLEEAIQSLPDRCREVFTLRRLYGLSQKEVAARLGLSERTVEAHSAVALRKCVQFFRRAEGAVSRRAGEGASEKSLLAEPIEGPVVRPA